MTIRLFPQLRRRPNFSRPDAGRPGRWRLTATGLLLAPLVAPLAGCQTQPVIVPGASMPSLLSQARAADAAGQTGRAQQLYQQVATIDPSNSIARRRLADFTRTDDFDTQIAAGSPVATPADPERFDRDALAAAEAEAVRAFGLIESQMVAGPVAEARRGSTRPVVVEVEEAETSARRPVDSVVVSESSPSPATPGDDFADFLATAEPEPTSEPTSEPTESTAPEPAAEPAVEVAAAPAAEPEPKDESVEQPVVVELLAAPPSEPDKQNTATEAPVVVVETTPAPDSEPASLTTVTEADDDADLFAEFLAQADADAEQSRDDRADETPSSAPRSTVAVRTISQSSPAEPLVRIDAGRLADTLREAPVVTEQAEPAVPIATAPSRRIVSPAVRTIDSLWERWQAGARSSEVAADLASQLRDATGSDDVEAETAALAALGQMGPEAAGVVTTLQRTLVQTASSDPLSLRAVRAADAILQIDPADRVANRAMQVVIKTGTGSQRVAAATALGRADETAVPFLRRTLRDPSEPVRAAAALALARQGRSAIRVVDDLREVATFDTPVVRQAAHVAIDRITR